MHLEIQVKNGKKYYYITETIRQSDKWKKVRIYLGHDLSKKEISSKIRERIVEFNEKTARSKNQFDPLLVLIPEPQIKELEAIKKEYKKNLGKIDKLQYQNHYENFVTQFTYDTNAIEGSTLSLQDTSMILFEKTVPKGKSLKEISEAQNHKDAFDLMLHYKGDITTRLVLRIHKVLMHNILWKYAGAFRDVSVYIRGASVKPPPSEKVEQEFKQLMIWYRRNKKKYHPIVVAALMHHGFESIHPFRDGNGRVGRLILNFILRKNGFPLIDIKYKDRESYYDALSKADEGNLKPLTDLIIKYIKEHEACI
ncbi:MAG TPA: Fic family protein [Candidatus Aenigmarchaeota archaeon]|nr:Fic family protein [Candidatus Aenigmarchaeota archaeon]